MPVVNYHTVNGQMVGQSTGTTFTQYLTDALGSVTATVNGKRVTNTYRYKPYGERLAKTGSGPDPDFQWTGGTGSRVTGRSRAEQYNRARHYGTSQASWTSQAHEIGSSYVFRRPTVIVHKSSMSGSSFFNSLLSMRVTYGPVVCNNYGMTVVNVQFVVPPSYTGYIVQEIFKVKSVLTCDGRPIERDSYIRHYWEAWRVDKGRIYATSPSGREEDITLQVHDSWREGGGYSCTQGNSTTRGYAKLWSDFSPEAEGFRPGGVEWAHGLLSTSERPRTWTNSNGIDRKQASFWGECCVKTGQAACPAQCEIEGPNFLAFTIGSHGIRKRKKCDELSWDYNRLDPNNPVKEACF